MRSAPRPHSVWETVSDGRPDCVEARGVRRVADSHVLSMPAGPHGFIYVILTELLYVAVDICLIAGLIVFYVDRRENVGVRARARLPSLSPVLP